MSFLDEPEETASRPPRRPPPPSGPPTDSQTLMTRRLMAGGVGLVVILILFFGIRACADARKAQSFQDYVSNVGELVSASNSQSETLFGLLEDPDPAITSVDVQNAVNGLRVEAEQLVERARGIKTPKELQPA